MPAILTEKHYFGCKSNGVGCIGGTRPSPVPVYRYQFGCIISFTHEDKNTECPRSERGSEFVRRFLTQMGLTDDKRG